MGLGGKHLRRREACRICSKGEIRKERTCVKRGKECTGLEEMDGKAEKQSKMEEVMLVALGGVASLLCVVAGFVVVFVWVFFFFFPFLKADHSAVANFFLSL